MTAPADLISQETLDRIARLKVRIEGAVQGVRSGLHRSPNRGASVIFAEHREYRPGDDTRRLDWRAFARSDRFTIKHFEQETHLTARLLCDRSSSMAYGDDGSGQCKATYSATLLGALALILLKQGDAVGADVFGTDLQQGLPARSRSGHLEPLVQLLATPPQVQGIHTDLKSALLQLGERLRSRSLVVVASDLLGDQEGPLSALSLLRSRGHTVWVAQILHRDELELPFTDSTRFVDPEGGAQLEVDPARVRTDYKQRVDQFVESWRSGCLSVGARYVLAPTDQPVHRVLSRLLGGKGQDPWA